MEIPEHATVIKIDLVPAITQRVDLVSEIVQEVDLVEEDAPASGEGA